MDRLCGGWLLGWTLQNFTQPFTRLIFLTVIIIHAVRIHCTSTCSFFSQYFPSYGSCLLVVINACLGTRLCGQLQSITCTCTQYHEGLQRRCGLAITLRYQSGNCFKVFTDPFPPLSLSLSLSPSLSLPLSLSLSLSLCPSLSLSLSLSLSHTHTHTLFLKLHSERVYTTHHIPLVSRVQYALRQTVSYINSSVNN